MSGRQHDVYVQSDDPLSMILEAVIRLAALVIGLGYAVAGALVRSPLLALSIGLAGGLTWWAGARALVSAALSIGVLLGVWRFASPTSFSRLAWPRLVMLWRGPYYRLRWRRVAERCSLVTQSHGVRTFEEADHDRIPRLLRVTTTASGLDRLLLRLPVGLTPDDVAASAEAVGLAFGAGEARVVTDRRPRRVWLELRRRDPLDQTLTPLPPGEVALGGVPIGLGDDGRPWRFRVEGTHALIAGATGAGKGSVLWSLMQGLSPAIAEGWVQVWAIDPKGGMELGLGRGAFARFEGGLAEAMCDLLEDAVELKTRRSLDLSTQGQRVHRPSVDSPHLVIVVDELATLSAFAGKERRAADRACPRPPAHPGAGRRHHGHRSGPGPGEGRGQLARSVPYAHRDAPGQPDPGRHGPGDGARERGAYADHISELTPGVAFVRVEGSRNVRRVRATYLHRRGRPGAVHVPHRGTHEGDVVRRGRFHRGEKRHEL